MRDKLVEDARLGGGFNIDRLAEIIAAEADMKTIVLVGHEPTMSATIGRAIGRAEHRVEEGGACGR